ncbi:MAG: NrtA/SsuA/CpmA family ABC transporter substrate-binding protein [Actinobacteria bacterium]|nr:NrtA/SsuA/CpmA family ABC transporter substrate-binding protein [Actinomycetota bacterium]
MAALLALGALIAGCGSSSDAATADGNGGGNASLTLGFVVDPSWAQVPVAEAEGYFAKHGVDVKVVDFSTGVEALNALKGGQVDITTAADFPVASAIASDPSMRIIDDGSRWNGQRIVANREDGITSFADLAGKKIGTPLGTTAHYYAAAGLQASGIEADVEQVNPPAIVAALTRGDIDATSIFEPFQIEAIKALGKNAVILEAPKLPYSQHSLYLANAETMESDKGAVSDFLAALREAEAPLEERDPAAVAAVAKATGLEPAITKQILSEFEYKSRLQPALAKTLDEYAEWAQENNFLPSSVQIPDYAESLDPSALPKG